MDRQANYELFYDTIKALSYSQGFYGRLLKGLDNMDDVERDNLIKSLPEFKDPADVIMVIEG